MVVEKSFIGWEGIERHLALICTIGMTIEAELLENGLNFAMEGIGTRRRVCAYVCPAGKIGTCQHQQRPCFCTAEDTGHLVHRPLFESRPHEGVLSLRQNETLISPT